ncbi:MAG: hypothetical protein H6624_17540 [Bdellovibrionaceae bacterium]|nr:hypothetical protein [Pseudobdellovibrionaceae bacterium]
MKILVVGGTQDFGKGVTEYLGPEAFGIGRSNGFDVCDRSVFKKIVEMSREYQAVVVVTNANNLQPELVEEIAIDWLERNHDGYLFCLGSTAVYHEKYDRDHRVWNYLRSKEGLRLLSKYIGEQVSKREVKMRFTNIQVGRLDNEKSRSKPGFRVGLKPEEVGSVVRFLLDTPKHLCVHEVYMDPKY